MSAGLKPSIGCCSNACRARSHDEPHAGWKPCGSKACAIDADGVDRLGKLGIGPRCEVVGAGGTDAIDEAGAMFEPGVAAAAAAAVAAAAAEDACDVGGLEMLRPPSPK